MQLQSHMTHQFSQVPRAEIQRSAFDRSHAYKTTFSAGDIVPFLVDEALPGDTFNVSLTAFARILTLIYPIMDNVFLDTFFFFVPYRLVWANFKKAMGEQANPGDSTSYTVPQMVSKSGGYDVGSLHDYMGLPTAGTNGVTAGKTYSHSALPLRAYNLIYNEWFRDQNMVNSVVVDTGDAASTYTDYSLLKRGKRHDYFTSALPWTQKGTAQSIPLTGTANVYGDGNNVTWWDGTNAFGGGFDGSTTYTADSNHLDDPVNSAYAPAGTRPTSKAAGLPTIASGHSSHVIADLSSASAVTINALRQAFQIQKMYERDARGGTRYTEIVRSHFGVVSPDARLQRPEYLGGGSSPLVVNPIAQTSGTSASGTTTPLGNLAAMGTFTARGHGFTKSFTEHGVILGLMAVRADLTYQQGLDRQWKRSTRFDFFWPALAQLGEQAITNDEIYCTGDAGDTTVFGYQERYAEYRYKNSKITGQLRSTYSTPLDAWHLAQKFTSAPTLNSTFIDSTPPMSRVKAVSGPDFIFDSFIQMKCVRPMPMFGVPGNIDRF